MSTLFQEKLPRGFGIRVTAGIFIAKSESHLIGTVQTDIRRVKIC